MSAEHPAQHVPLNTSVIQVAVIIMIQPFQFPYHFDSFRVPSQDPGFGEPISKAAVGECQSAPFQWFGQSQLFHTPSLLVTDIVIWCDFY